MTRIETRTIALNRPTTRTALLIAVTLGLLAALVLGPVSTAQAAPPEPPTAAEATEQLAGLTVEAEGSDSDYDRDLFPHWSDQGNNCDTRDEVLKRDGEGVEVDADCEPTAGTWYSVYDDQTIESDSDIQIDHIVPLSESWGSGTDEWTTDQRETFANDLEHSQLVAVSGTSNQEKSDKDPAEWVPSNTETHCLYARQWIWVKSTYELSIDEAEKGALEKLLGTC